MDRDDGFFMLVLGVLAAVLTIVLWWHQGAPGRAATMTPAAPVPAATVAPTATAAPTTIPTAAPTVVPTPAPPSPTPTASVLPTATPTPTPAPPSPTELEAELEAELNAIVAAEPIEFEVGSAQLTEDSTATVDRIVALIDDSPHRIIVIGHTDDRGDALQNEELSFERARSVVNFLVANGVDELRIRAVGRGGSEPIADNDTEDGRARNRRIEFEVIAAED